MADPDDALSWAGDEPDPVAAPASTATADREGLPGMLLITFGVLAGIFLIYTLGWIITVTRSGTSAPGLLDNFMLQLGNVLAVVAPALWFVTAFVITTGRKPIVRLLALLLGLVVVLPWPFVLGA
jgi:hypothetical protein